VNSSSAARRISSARALPLPLMTCLQSANSN
jgi:hypothetical protein